MAEALKVELKGDLTHARAAAARMAIMEALGKADEVAVDLSQLSSLDLTLPQLLVSAQLSAASAGKRLTFPGLLNTELAKMAFDLGIARPDGVGDEWPW